LLSPGQLTLLMGFKQVIKFLSSSKNSRVSMFKKLSASILLTPVASRLRWISEVKKMHDILCRIGGSLESCFLIAMMSTFWHYAFLMQLKIFRFYVFSINDHYTREKASVVWWIRSIWFCWANFLQMTVFPRLISVSEFLPYLFMINYIRKKMKKNLSIKLLAILINSDNKLPQSQ
jgi:hypothetical protein